MTLKKAKNDLYREKTRFWGGGCKKKRRTFIINHVTERLKKLTRDVTAAIIHIAESINTIHGFLLTPRSLKSIKCSNFSTKMTF